MRRRVPWVDEGPLLPRDWRPDQEERREDSTDHHSPFPVVVATESRHSGAPGLAS